MPQCLMINRTIVDRWFCWELVCLLTDFRIILCLNSLGSQDDLYCLYVCCMGCSLYNLRQSKKKILQIAMFAKKNWPESCAHFRDDHSIFLVCRTNFIIDLAQNFASASTIHCICEAYGRQIIIEKAHTKHGIM